MKKQFVADALDLNVADLCNDDALGVDAIVVEAGTHPLLLVREDLLCSTSDIFILAGEHVGPSWGYGHVKVSASSGGMRFYPNEYEGDELYGWRARTVVDDLEVVRRQLAELRKMGRQVPVQVYSI